MDYEEGSCKLSSVSSSEEYRMSIQSPNGGDSEEGDERFYEEIEAPKFVDFTQPDRHRPDDDHYWFCLRVGCDQKHEEEMDSEAIYKNFVLRVMAARSPNIRLRKALDRNASRTPTKCPLSAPPKSSKPRLSRMAIISSIPTNKIVDAKKGVVRPLLKPIIDTTPKTKTKPVASKYLTTPRNRNCKPNEKSFQSVQNPKPTMIEVPKSRVAVAKALVFHSPKKTIKVKTSVELKTPVSKLCKGMNKLDISNQKKDILSNSGKLHKNLSSNPSTRLLSSHKAQRNPSEPCCSQTDTNKEGKSRRSIGSKIKGKSKKLMGNDHTDKSKGVKEQLTERIECSSTTNTKANDNRTDNCNSESCVELVKTPMLTMEGDDKENAAAASDENRLHQENVKQNGKELFGMHDKFGQAKPKVGEVGVVVSTGSAAKLTKPRATNLKPFRLRTSEREILKETNLERRPKSLATQGENANFLSVVGGKLHKKQGSGIKDLKLPKPATSATPGKNNRGQEPKLMRSEAMRRLEKFRKMKSPLQQNTSRPPHHGPTSSTINEKVACFLIPGQKLEVIHETSPDVTELRRTGKAVASVVETGNGPLPLIV